MNASTEPSHHPPVTSDAVLPPIPASGPPKCGAHARRAEAGHASCTGLGWWNGAPRALLGSASSAGFPWVATHGGNTLPGKKPGGFKRASLRGFDPRTEDATPRLTGSLPSAVPSNGFSLSSASIASFAAFGASLWQSTTPAVSAEYTATGASGPPDASNASAPTGAWWRCPDVTATSPAPAAAAGPLGGCGSLNSCIGVCPKCVTWSWKTCRWCASVSACGSTSPSYVV